MVCSSEVGIGLCCDCWKFRLRLGWVVYDLVLFVVLILFVLFSLRVCFSAL